MEGNVVNKNKVKGLESDCGSRGRDGSNFKWDDQGRWLLRDQATSPSKEKAF